MAKRKTKQSLDEVLPEAIITDNDTEDATVSVVITNVPLELANTITSTNITELNTENDVIDEISEWCKSKNLDKMQYDHKFDVTNIFEEVLKSFGQGRTVAEHLSGMVYTLENNSDTPEEFKIDMYCKIIEHCSAAMLKLGYSPKQSLKESLKELNDSTGYYNPELGDWVKEPKKKDMYKANFSTSKIK